MNIGLSVVSGILLSVLVANVSVAENPVEQATADSRNFTGFFVGGQLGANRISARLHGRDESDSSLSYEGLVGWRYQFDGLWVLGIEGALGDRKGGLSTEQQSIDFDYLWHWSAMGGKVFGQTQANLVYATVGVGGIQVDATVHGNQLPLKNFKGVRTALGYERALSERISLRAEASYISYDPHFDQLQASVGVLVKF